jgi:uncharacterized protein YndB with AHSA1/START domain
MLKLGLIVIALLTPALACADVADSAANGFTLKIGVTIQAAPADVYSKLVHSIGDWWNSMHTFTGNAHNLSIDDKPLGCFCETRGLGTSGIRHMEVINVDYNKSLVMTGAFGPLQPLAATGTMSIQLTPAGDGTKVSIVYALAGYSPTGLSMWAGPVDSVLTEQFVRLKSYIETGKPDGGKAVIK